MEAVFEAIVKKEGLFSFGLIAKEIDYYYNHLSFEPSYYKTFSTDDIAQHIHSLIEVLAGGISLSRGSNVDS